MRKFPYIQYTGLTLLLAILLPTFAFAGDVSNRYDPWTYRSLKNANLDSYICYSFLSISMPCETSTNSNLVSKTSSRGYPALTNPLEIIPFSGFFKPRSNLIRVEGTEPVFVIEKNKKHWIPTKEIFDDYGYKSEDIKNVSIEEFNSYPRMKLVYKKGEKKNIYYLTEIGLLRLIPDKDILDSYGVNSREALAISEKEFNLYGKNIYVYQENPYNSDVFLLDFEKKEKQYVAPIAAKRIGIQSWQVAPVSKAELDYYKTFKPIVN